MSSIKVSIVVPVYNVERDLPRCVNSLMNQTLKSIEIILVDDESPDNCSEMCDEYSRCDNRIRVIHKINGGLSDARNAGLEVAKGQYILFVDSDDYINENTCEVLYLHASKDDLDIVVGDGLRIENDTMEHISHAKVSFDRIMSGKDFLKEQLIHHSMHMAVWLNLYKKEFLKTNQIFFKKGIFHEDEQWTPRVFLKAEKVKYTKFAFYNYIIRQESITSSKNKFKNGVDLVNTCYELEKIYGDIKDKELREELNDYLVMLFLHAVNAGNLYDKKYDTLYNKNFLIGKSKSLRNKIKSGLFILNRNLYRYINRLTKI